MAAVMAPPEASLSKRWGAAKVGRVGFDVDAIDVFCGFGGSSSGIHAAGATVLAAANHSELAIECHARNFPDTDHWQADMVDPVNPEVLNRAGKTVPGRYLDPADLPRARFAWFSPSCRYHSQANAKKVYERSPQLTMMDDEADEWDADAYANSERSRVTMMCVLKYVDAHHPETTIVENVLEVTKWGPNKDGSVFRWWMTELRNMGYEVKLVFLNSMFFAPCPQSRDRVYIVAWRKGNKAPDLDYRPTAFCTSDACGGTIVQSVQTWKPRTKAWMADSWGKYIAQYDYRCERCRAVVHPASWMALTAIDWSNLGPTLEEKIEAGKRPAVATWERIRRAVQKYRYAPPVIIADEATMAGMTMHVAHADSVSVGNAGSDVAYAGNRSRSVGEHLPTLAQRNTIALALDGTVVPIQASHRDGEALATPFPTLVAGGNHLALALTVKNNGSIDEAGYRAHHAGDPLGAIVGSARPQSILALVVPNRTHNRPGHASEQFSPVMTSATEGVVIAAAGNTSERPGQTRGRHVAEPLYTQSTTNEFGIAALPVLRGDHFQENHAGESLDTVSAGGNHQAVVTALFSKINGGPTDTAWHGVNERLNTITGRDTTGIVIVPWVDQWLSEPIAVTEQLATITARLRHSLASLPPSDEPVTDEMLLQVRFRMLQPDPELRRAMAFDDRYILLGNKGEMTAGLGNAVTPPVAEWLTRRCLETLGLRRAA